ncbi:preprotein translocase subunit SecG [Planctomycetota bacterium]|nr:preprotein translocase subunit SecG [Planctomycetota bacterium]
MNLLLGILFVINSVMLIVFVLFRQSDSGGIGAAFGGGDSGGAFGTKGQAVVDKVITFMGASFMVLSLVFSLYSNSSTTKNVNFGGGESGEEAPADPGGE